LAPLTGRRHRRESAVMSEAVLHLPPEVLRLTHQLELEKFDSLQRRYDVLRRENELLKHRLEKSEKDTHEFVAYFEKELEAKDVKIDALSDEVGVAEAERSAQVGELKAKHKEVADRMAAELEKTQTSSAAQVSTLEDELAKVDAFRDLKTCMDDKLAALQSEVHALRHACAAEATTYERKLMFEKAQMQKDFEKKAAEMRKVAKAEMQKGLDSDTLKVISENRRMAEELRFQQTVAQELSQDKAKCDDSNRILKRQVTLFKDAELEYARQAHSRHREVTRLQDKVVALDELLRDAAKQFSADRSQLRSGLQSNLEEQTLDAAALRQMLRLKDKELKHLRKLAEGVLHQRTEVEQYFLQALEDVKSEIRGKRKDQYRADMANYRQKMAAAVAAGNGANFPKIRSLQAGKDMDAYGLSTQAVPPHAASSKVHLKDLSPEDREHVLRLLFAKINAVQSNVPTASKQHLGDSTFLTTSGEHETDYTSAPAPPPPRL